MSTKQNYAHKLHDMLGDRKVPTQVRRIAIGVAIEADEEVTALQARCAALEEALRECLQVLGPSAPACVGCSAEIGIALEAIKAALSTTPDAPAEGAKNV